MLFNRNRNADAFFPGGSFTHRDLPNKKKSRKNSHRISPQIWSGNKHDQAILVTKFCSDSKSGSHHIVQTSKFVLINATSVTLGQGQRKVIQYIYPDLYFLCPKYLRLSANGFDVRGKSRVGGGGGANELKI